MNRDTKICAVFTLDHADPRSPSHAAARRLLSRPRRVEREVPAVKSAKDRKAESEAKRRAELDRIIPLVYARAQGRCEWCPMLGREYHHLLSGPERRRLESVDTIALTCGPCHRSFHRNDVSTLVVALDWARSRGFHTAAAAIRRRLDKVNRTRRTA